MGRTHFQKYHSDELPIKKCLRCLINKLKFANGNLQNELTFLKETHDTQLDNLKNENDRLRDELTYLKDELRMAQDRKDLYKGKYYKQTD